MVIEGTTYDGARRVRKLPQLFTRYASLSNKSVLVRKFIEGENDQGLYKYDMETESLSKAIRITDKRLDGGLSTDGELLYDKATGLVAYVEHNSNKITMLDSNLNVKNTGHTIDTFSTNIYKSMELVKRNIGMVTSNAPLQFVNIRGILNRGILYVQSGVH